MPSSCKFGFLPIQVALVLDDLPGQLRVSFKYYTFLFPFSRILYSPYVDKVWIFPFLPRLLAAAQDSLSHALALSLATLNGASISILISFFKVLNLWIMDQVPIGNKAPRPGYARKFWCPACCGILENPLALTSGHVLLECVAVEGT